MLVHAYGPMCAPFGGWMSSGRQPVDKRAGGGLVLVTQGGPGVGPTYAPGSGSWPEESVGDVPLGGGAMWLTSQMHHRTTRVAERPDGL